jgi:hypothetical protein
VLKLSSLLEGFKLRSWVTVCTKERKRHCGTAFPVHLTVFCFSLPYSGPVHVSACLVFPALFECRNQRTGISQSLIIDVILKLMSHILPEYEYVTLRILSAI